MCSYTESTESTYTLQKLQSIFRELTTGGTAYVYIVIYLERRKYPTIFLYTGEYRVLTLYDGENTT